MAACYDNLGCDTVLAAQGASEVLSLDSSQEWHSSLRVSAPFEARHYSKQVGCRTGYLVMVQPSHLHRAARQPQRAASYVGASTTMLQSRRR